jgi:DNA segregation ATPase FtsK/SpoIIIE-like protein
MKNKIKMLVVFLMICTGTTVAPQKAAAQVSVSFQVFYDDLSPYGNWVDNSNYGYVWVPNVSYGFSPYSTNGYWVFTDEGWAWVSNYSWGWAPFHYGRWFYENSYGWIWVPDYEWGPGWVSWRRSNDYYGWAPIGPGINIDIAYSSGYNLPNNQWTFVRNRDFGRANINNYYVNNSNNVTIINNSTVINNIRVDNSRNTRYNTGPDRNEAERRAGKTFKPVVVRETNKPGQHLRNGELEIYKPRIEKNNDGQRKPSPSKVVRIEDVKTADKRTPANTQQQQQQNDQQNKQQQNQEKKRNDELNKQQQQRDNQQKQQQQQQQRDNQQKQQQQQQQPDNQQKQQQRDNQHKQQQQQQRDNQQKQQQRDNQPKQQQQQQKQQQQQQPQQQQSPGNQPPVKREPTKKGNG